MTSLLKINSIIGFLLLLNCFSHGQSVDCEVEYPDNVFWGHLPGQGDFQFGIDSGGWTADMFFTWYQDSISWSLSEDGYPLTDIFFGGDIRIDSPTNCNGAAIFDCIGFFIDQPPNAMDPPSKVVGELVSPIIDCSDKDSVILEFYMLFNTLPTQCVMLSVSIDGGDTWEAI
jgi:hypothetical protein